MRIWIDALTPKQLIFFHFVSEELKKRGHEIFMTTRHYHDSIYVVKRLGIQAEVIGEHGGKDAEKKLIASLKRSLQLVDYVKYIKPELAISFSSPEAARVSTGLGIKHVAVNDSPHSLWVAKLTIPLSTLLFTPWVIPVTVWRRFGAEAKRIITYHALDPAAWIKNRDLWPKPTDFELSARGAIIVREPETQASYMEKNVISVMNIVKLLSERFRDKKIIVLPRYKEQEEELENMNQPNISVCREPFFGPNLLSSSLIFVGGGGTMNAEAALLGVPVISFYEGPATYVERYLTKSGLIIKVRSERECVRQAMDILENYKGEEIKKRAEEELQSMENPAEVIAERLDRLQTI